MRIPPIANSGIEYGMRPAPEAVSKRAENPSFVSELMSKVNEMDALQHKADQASADAAISGATNMHETLIQVEQADISMRLLGKFRNKALEAYHEIMRMQF